MIPVPHGKEWTTRQVVDFCFLHDRADLAGWVIGFPPPRPFRSDGCTLVADTVFGVDVTIPCVLHDIEYWSGTRETERLFREPADVVFFRATVETVRRGLIAKGRPGWLAGLLARSVGGVRLFGVRVGGWSGFRAKGVSWAYGRI